MNYCPNCGKKIDGDYNFCPSCGASLEKVKESTVVEPKISETTNVINKPTYYGGEYKNSTFVLALLSVIVELMFIIVANSVPEMTLGLAWTTLIVFILCTAGSIVGLVLSIKAMKRGIKGKAIAGLVLSIVGLALGSIFLISFLIGLLSY